MARRDLEGRAERIVAVALEQVVQLVDVADPDVRTTMDELGDVRERVLAEADQVLALEVALPRSSSLVQVFTE